MDAAASLADRFSHGELRVTHDRACCPVREGDLPALWLAAVRRIRHRTSAC
jgi:sulfite reductase (NADPH) hemoprotein beta-component